MGSPSLIFFQLLSLCFRLQFPWFEVRSSRSTVESKSHVGSTDSVFGSELDPDNELILERKGLADSTEQRHEACTR